MRRSGLSSDAVELRNVGLEFSDSREVLRSVSYKISNGEFAFLTGKSGSGKTSLMRMMHLDLLPSSGEVSIFGESVVSASRQARSETRRRIGVVFQNFRLMPHLTVFDNLALPLSLRNYTQKLIEKYVEEMLEWIGLQEWRHAPVQRLSGGQQQLVAVARAVVFQPNLLLADEPTGNVDEAMAKRLMYLFNELNKLGMTVIIATHNFSLIEKFPRRVLNIAEGRLVSSSTKAETS